MFIHPSVKYYIIKSDRVRVRTTYILRFADRVLTRRTLPRNSNFCFLTFIHRIFSCQKLWWDQMESLHKLFVEVLWIFFLNRAQKKLSSLVFIIFGMKGFPSCSSEWQIEIEYGACITISAMSNISGGIILFSPMLWFVWILSSGCYFFLKWRLWMICAPLTANR